jgi:hypothetical protein
MCRDIKILRAPYTAAVSDQDVQAAAIQYVQTVSGFRRPMPADTEVFDRAVDMIASVTRALLARLDVTSAVAPGPDQGLGLAHGARMGDHQRVWRG